jgi:hypothetical protein
MGRLNPQQVYTYPGNIHIHSTHSDGSENMGQIAAEASEAGLSYIIITDHETLVGLPEEGIDQGVVVLVGAEINCRKNHYLALGIDEVIDSDDDCPQRVIDQVRQAGGLGFIAHPFDRGSRYIEKGKAYPWTDWPVFGFNGLEIWNYSSHWRGLHPSLFRTLYWFFFNRTGAMKGPPRRLLRLWDCYNLNGHRTVAIGGSDAHAYLYRFAFMRIVIFTYRYTFTTINTYIVLRDALSGDFAEAKMQILKALKDGRCYTAYDSFHPAKDLYCCAEYGEEKALIGEAIEYRKNMRLTVKTPGKRTLIRLICDGEVIVASKASFLEYNPTRPGLYRVEVYHRSLFGPYRPWIYANPIYITARVTSMSFGKQSNPSSSMIFC